MLVGLEKLTCRPLRVHVIVGAGREDPDVQFARSVSPTGNRCLSTAIVGSVSGTSGNWIIEQMYKNL